MATVPSLGWYRVWYLDCLLLGLVFCLCYDGISENMPELFVAFTALLADILTTFTGFPIDTFLNPLRQITGYFSRDIIKAKA